MILWTSHTLKTSHHQEIEWNQKTCSLLLHTKITTTLLLFNSQGQEKARGEHEFDPYLFMNLIQVVRFVQCFTKLCLNYNTTWSRQKPQLPILRDGPLFFWRGGERLFFKTKNFFCVVVCANNFYPAASPCRQFIFVCTARGLQLVIIIKNNIIIIIRTFPACFALEKFSMLNNLWSKRMLYHVLFTIV